MSRRRSCCEDFPSTVISQDLNITCTATNVLEIKQPHFNRNQSTDTCNIIEDSLSTVFEFFYIIPLQGMELPFHLFKILKNIHVLSSSEFP